jgi:aryl-alcohol dehydrogenase-like predicted oxidoreductase
MKYRTIGKSGIEVSEISFGAWTIALDWGGKKIDDDQGIRMLKRAFDLGINFYETADVYGNGKSEKLLAQAFKDMRGEVVYSTKRGYDMNNSIQLGQNELPQRHDTEYLQFALKRSLERLQTDFVDIYSLHNPKMDIIQNDELFGDLDDLVRIGTIKSHGIALGPGIGWRGEGLIAIAHRNNSCLQTVYNIIEQYPGRDLMKAASILHNDVGILVRVPDASGLLTGKVNSNTSFSNNDHRRFRSREFIMEAIQKIENLKPLASDKGWSITELAVKFILSQQEISVPIY